MKPESRGASPATSPPAASPRGEALRAQMLWAAREVFLEAGFERASMDEVASRAGTTKRTLYAHFENKNKLFLAVFEMLQGYFLGRLKTPDAYSDDPAEALVLFCGRFMETLLYEGAIRMCRVCAAEADKFPGEAARYCYVVFTEVENRLAVYLAKAFGLTARASTEAAERLLGQVLHPRFTRALFGVEPLFRTINEEGLSPGFDVKPIRAAVSDLLDSLQQRKAGKSRR